MTVAPRAITDAQIAAVEWVDESGVPICLHCRRVKSFFGHWGHTDDCPLAPLLAALRAAREPAGRELENAVIAAAAAQQEMCERLREDPTTPTVDANLALQAAVREYLARLAPDRTKGNE